MIMFETGLPAKSGPGVMLAQHAIEALGNGGPEAMLAFDLQEPCRAR